MECHVRVCFMLLPRDIVLTQDSEVSQRHEDGLHAARSRPRQYQNSLRGRDATGRTVNPTWWCVHVIF